MDKNILDIKVKILYETTIIDLHTTKKVSL